MFGRTNDELYRRALISLTDGSTRIDIGGELDYPRYVEELQNCDVVLVPSRDDTLPLVSLDALALGKPLVCSETTGTSNYLEDRRSAMIVRSLSPQTIADALAPLISDPALRQVVGAGGRSVFEAHFTRDAFQHRIDEKLREVRNDIEVPA